VNAVPYVTAYSYDSAGRMSGMTYPSGRTVTYTFDALGRVSEIDTTKDTQTQAVVPGIGGLAIWDTIYPRINSRLGS